MSDTRPSDTRPSDTRPFEVLETGVMFWAGRDPGETIEEMKALGVRCGQLALPGDLDLSCAPAWKEALQAADFTVYTVFATFQGESYADKPTVYETVGFIPPATRAERERRTCRVSDFAAVIGAPAIATHVGCVPDDDTSADHIAVREMVRRICDHAETHGQKFALETGQETAPVLLDFMLGVNRPNLGINFDPANLEMLSKGELHRRCVYLGEVPQLGFEERSQNRSKWACKVSKSRTALLLNNFNQLHHCKNVFVSDGASMVSTSTQNPSLTFMALAARAANHAVEELKKGNL